MQEFIVENIEIVGPWLLLAFVIYVFAKLFGWAKNRKTGAVIFGLLVQMVMPDPYAERTVKIVQEEKKETKKQAEGDSQDTE